MFDWFDATEKNNVQLLSGKYLSAFKEILVNYGEEPVTDSSGEIDNFRIVADLSEYSNSKLIKQALSDYSAKDFSVETHILREEERLFFGREYAKRVLKAIGDKQELSWEQWDDILRQTDHINHSTYSKNPRDNDIGQIQFLNMVQDTYIQLLNLQESGIEPVIELLEKQVKSHLTPQCLQKKFAGKLGDELYFLPDMTEAETQKFLAINMWENAVVCCSEMRFSQNEWLQKSGKGWQGIVGKSPAAQMAQAYEIALNGGKVDGTQFTGIKEYVVNKFCCMSGITEGMDPDAELLIRNKLEKLFTKHVEQKVASFQKQNTKDR